MVDTIARTHFLAKHIKDGLEQEVRLTKELDEAKLLLSKEDVICDNDRAKIAEKVQVLRNEEDILQKELEKNYAWQLEINTYLKEFKEPVLRIRSRVRNTETLSQVASRYEEYKSWHEEYKSNKKAGDILYHKIRALNYQILGLVQHHNRTCGTGDARRKIGIIQRQLNELTEKLDKWQTELNKRMGITDE